MCEYVKPKEASAAFNWNVYSESRLSEILLLTNECI